MGKIDDSIWRGILNHVRKRGNGLGQTWFDRLEPGEFEAGVLEVYAQTGEQRTYLTDHCSTVFREAAQAATGRLVSVEFTFRDKPGEKAAVRPRIAAEHATDGDEQIPLNPEYTFKDFVIGPGNRLAHAAAVAVSKAPGQAYNPLFLHGSVGLGKTHLLQAVCRNIRRNAPEKRILYLSCEAFTNHFIEAVEQGAFQNFRYRYRYVDVLAIDDIQCLAGRERTQEAFFHTFNTLYQAQGQIILSADGSPKEIPHLEDRLVSRFNWGLVSRIDPPCFETRIAIVQKKAKARQLRLPEDVASMIASRIKSNTRELEGAILKVAAFSQEAGGIITEAIAEQALGEAMPGPITTVRLPDIVAVVTQQYGVKLTELQGKRRNRSVALPRQVCMYLARELTPLSLEEIGGYFGGRDHTTVLHAHRAIRHQEETNPRLAQILGELRKHLERP